MNFSRLGLFVCLLMTFASRGWTQQGEDYRSMATPEVRSDKLSAPEHLRNYVVDGKLRLAVRDAIVLTLENNSMVRVQETQIDAAKFTLLGTHQPFDPVIATFYNVNSSSSAPFSQLQGTGASSTFISTTQIAQLIAILKRVLVWR